MLASLSRIRFGTAALAGGAGAGLLPEPSEAKRLGGGLPGGVVDSSADKGTVRATGCVQASAAQGGEDNVRVNILVGRGAFSVSLNELTMEGGNVWPFSQISTSFFIFSYGQSSW
jgi:hypothetical protein